VDNRGIRAFKEQKLFIEKRDVHVNDLKNKNNS